jgi:hypothetical protein
VICRRAGTRPPCLGQQPHGRRHPHAGWNPRPGFVWAGLSFARKPNCDPKSTMESGDYGDNCHAKPSFPNSNVDNVQANVDGAQDSLDRISNPLSDSLACLGQSTFRIRTARVHGRVPLASRP